MAKFYPQLDEKLEQFIKQQKMFFVATADASGRVNVSPKGSDSFRILGPKRIAWLSLTGSGNETAAHLQELNRMTIMFCALEGRSKILRLYGQAATLHPGDEGWDDLASCFPDDRGARQIFDMLVDSLQTSCGFGVPLYEYMGEREQLKAWAERKSDQDIQTYWETRNSVSIDGKPIKRR